MSELSRGSVFSRSVEFKFDEYDGPETLQRHYVSVLTFPGTQCVSVSAPSTTHETRRYQLDGEPSDEALEIFAHGFLKNILDNENDN